MASRFRVFHTDIALAVHNVDAVILACCVLHNYLRRKSASYSPNTYVDEEDTESGQLIPGQWRDNGNHLTPLQRTARASTDLARQARDKYKEYFNNEGSVPFQKKMVFL
jgi:hypothetical protein